MVGGKRNISGKLSSMHSRSNKEIIFIGRIRSLPKGNVFSRVCLSCLSLQRGTRMMYRTLATVPQTCLNLINFELPSKKTFATSTSPYIPPPPFKLVQVGPYCTGTPPSPPPTPPPPESSNRCTMKHRLYCRKAGAWHSTEISFTGQERLIRTRLIQSST